jgi:hypothetical protein
VWSSLKPPFLRSTGPLRSTKHDTDSCWCSAGWLSRVGLCGIAKTQYLVDSVGSGVIDTLPSLNLPSMKNLAVSYLNWREKDLYERANRLSNNCAKHPVRGNEDTCPCMGKVLYLQDRIEESFYRLSRQRHQVGFWRWLLWYIISGSMYAVLFFFSSHD